MSIVDVVLIAIVTVAFATEAAIGFGATLITISVGSLLLPTSELLYAVLPLNSALSAAVVLRARTHVDGRLLLLRILPWMALGFPIGVLAFTRLPEDALKRALGAFVLVLAGLELAKKLRAAPVTIASVALPVPGATRGGEADTDTDVAAATANGGERPLPRAAALGLLFLGGVVHGAFGTGGPPVVYVCARLVPDKRVFRATLTVLWLVLGLVLVAVHVKGGHIGPGSLRRSALLAPGFVLGLIGGEIAHHRIPERAFRAVVFAMLAVVGAVLAIRG
jgi:uncharacterized membrane protein YfcA